MEDLIKKKTLPVTFTFLGKEDYTYGFEVPIIGQATIRIPNDIIDTFGSSAERLFNSLSQSTRYRAYKHAGVKSCDVCKIVYL